MGKIKDFIAENSIVLVIGVCLLLLIYWLHHDANRNKPVYNNTDNTMADIDKRISSLESRLDTMSKRVEETQKTVSGIAVGISRSTGYAIEIDEGLGRAEERLESAITRSQRIEAIIQDIERTNK